MLDPPVSLAWIAGLPPPVGVVVRSTITSATSTISAASATIVLKSWPRIVVFISLLLAFLVALNVVHSA